MPAEPSTAEPSTAEPSTAEPSTAEPSTAEPSTAEPSTAEPSTAEPSTTQRYGDSPLSARLTEGLFERQRAQGLLRRFPGFCYSVDTELRFTSSEGAGLPLLNLRDHELVGRQLTELWGTTNPEYEPYACHLRALCGKVESYRDVCLGRSIDYELRPLRDEGGAIVGVLGVGVDVTERVAASREAAVRASELGHAQRVESLGQLAGGVAHDFNNLLTCIAGNLALLERLHQGNAAAEAQLREANEALDRAASLSRQLLEFGRKRAVTPRLLSLSRLVERVQSLLVHLIGENIALQTSLPRDLWSVRADSGQLEQALVNLVVNARDAILGQGTITISTRNLVLGEPLLGDLDALAAGSYVELSVRDTGEGIADGLRKRLFEPFFTTKEAGRGTGLGLPTVHAAARAGGGTVLVDSIRGKGSTFRIVLPAQPTAAVLPEPEAPEQDASPSIGGTETILVVEDEPHLLELCSCTLEQLGYRVLACQNADAALRALEASEGPIDLLFTDYILPDMSGKALASRLRALRPQVKVVFTSGYDMTPEAQTDVLDATYLEKPYRPQRLAQVIRGALDRPPSASAPFKTHEGERGRVRSD